MFANLSSFWSSQIKHFIYAQVHAWAYGLVLILAFVINAFLFLGLHFSIKFELDYPKQ